MVDKHCFTQLTVGNLFIVLLCLTSSALLTGCAISPSNQLTKELLYQAPQPNSVKNSHTPAFLIKEAEKQFNRIGMPSVRESADQKTEIYVDPDKSAIFFETKEFTTTRGKYRNLIYRIHFEKVPFALNQFNITAGKNSGILIIYTLDSEGVLLLVTTVHTCGCYLAFLPTKALPEEWFPSDWPQVSQWVYGYTLPSLLHLDQSNDAKKIVFTLESETHRISNVTVAEHDTLKYSYDAIEMDLLSMSSLYRLPFRDATESFFEMSGAREGYVRNNTKFLEWLLISWWAFDFNVGEDKAFGSDDTSETIFYTSLKFWDRKASDLKNFPGFLSYWGWKL